MNGRKEAGALELILPGFFFDEMYKVESLLVKRLMVTSLEEEVYSLI